MNRLDNVLQACATVLTRRVEQRMDPLVRARMDAEDIVQDGLLELVRRRSLRWGTRQADPARLLSFLVLQKRIEHIRRHLATQKRDARREVPGRPASRSGAAGAGRLEACLDPGPTPLERVMGKEARGRIRTALRAMAGDLRGVLLLRYFHHLANREVARLLCVSESTASRRHDLALGALRRILVGPGSRAGSAERRPALSAP